MRRRLRNFLPIVLIALAVQIFAPIAACWAASIAASDPLHAVMICRDNSASTPGQADQPGHGSAHDGCCSTCSVAQTAAPLGTPQFGVAAPWRVSVRVVWLGSTRELFGSRVGSQAQARAPPQAT